MLPLASDYGRFASFYMPVSFRLSSLCFPLLPSISFYFRGSILFNGLRPIRPDYYFLACLPRHHHNLTLFISRQAGRARLIL